MGARVAGGHRSKKTQAELRAEAEPRPPPSRASEDWSPGTLGVAGGRPSRFVAGRRAAADAPAADSEGAFPKSADAPPADA